MGQPLCHQISSPTLFCSPLPVSCPCPTRNMVLSWWPIGMNPLERPVLSLIVWASICFPSYFNAEGVLPPLQSSRFSVCPGFSSAVSSLALLVILLLSWLSSSSSFSSWWTPTDLCSSEVTWPRGSAPPLYSHSKHSSHSGHRGLLAWFPTLQGKLPEGHNCIFFALCRACVNEREEWWMNSSQKKICFSFLGAVSKVD